MDTNVVSLAVLSNFKSGDLVVDMLILVAIKYLFDVIFPQMQPMMLRLMQKLRWKSKEARRSIRVVQRTFGRGLPGQEDTRNQILQKSIAMYVGSLARLRRHPKSQLWVTEEEWVDSGLSRKGWADAERRLRYAACECELKAVKEQESQKWGDFGRVWGSTHEQLQCYSIVPLPEADEWAVVADGVEFKYVTEEQSEGDEGRGSRGRRQGGGQTGSTLTSTYQFRSSAADGEERVDSFIQAAFEWYKAEMKRNEDDGRYMYTLAPGSAGSQDDEEKRSGKEYKRYALSGAKTFETLFIPEKAEILRLVDNFMHQRDKFAIPGFPHKLGLLLHGPPGTGKTSFIKCLANYTGRHIVNVPLSRINTNQELMDIMFDQKYRIPDEDMPVRLGFAQVIYVMEDIDCASDIVHTRQKKGGMEKQKKLRLPASEEKAEAQLLTRAMTEDDDAADGMSREASIDPSVCPIDLPPSPRADDASEKGDDKKKKNKFGPYDKKSIWEEKDKLNLAGLLNVLDGVVDTPNRIVVMTTNHPEKLDPALVRPGRINKRLFLGYLRCEQAAEMIRHYFDEAPDMQALRKVMKEERFTPAEMEQFCAEFDTVPELLAHLGRVLEAQPLRAVGERY
eukprot:TRINITY_DN7548_c0_g2_i1.p1 TRINITY_DN7548_c0_g2~~TRINITY_DN7548_c0_g2_i1.p1  ORF type:complete len:620 (+),score=178.29 TRINITY_DN7548_c0_g2_i1:146-2005(+)